MAGFKTAASASACFGPIKKKLLAATGGDIVAASGSGSTPKKSNAKSQAQANDDNHQEGEGAAVPATTAKATPKKRSKAKTPAAEIEGGDLADTEQTPAVSPKKRAAGKAAAVAPADNVGGEEEAHDDGITNESPVKPKRKRGPNKPKDPNAPPTAKRAKKNANADASAIKTEGSPDDTAAANSQLQGNGNATSLFGDGVKPVKSEVNDGDDEEEDRVFTAEEQKLADEKLFATHDSDQEAA